MRALVGKIPRGFPDHRRKETQGYKHDCRETLKRWPGAPYRLIKEHGRLADELDRLAAWLAEAQQKPNRRRESRRLREERRKTLGLLLEIEGQLAEAVRGNGHVPAFDLAAELEKQESLG